MQELYKFETKYFRFCDDELQLLRSRFPFRKIPIKNLTSISIGNGSRLKHPIRGVLFGIVILFSSTYLLLESLGLVNYIIDGNIKEGEYTGTGKFASFLIAIIGFTFFVGITSLLQAIIPTTVMRAEFKNGQKDTFPLNQLNNDELVNFKRFLSDKFEKTSCNLEI